MSNETGLPEPVTINSWLEEMAAMSDHIKHQGANAQALNILEAGCGNMTGLTLDGVQYTVTGVDIDQDAFKIRERDQRALDRSILGDLRTVKLDRDTYDVIYNSYVLEHIEGADTVLNNFMQWLKPGGILILRIPNRDSVRGFLTRITPFWFHVVYTRYLQGYKDAGKPGHAPFPTYYDSVVSRKGIHDFCRSRGLNVKAEYSGGHGRKNRKISMILDKTADLVLHSLTANLFSRHTILIYIIEKPLAGARNASGITRSANKKASLG